MKDTKPRLLILVDWFAPAYKAGGPVQSCLHLAMAMRGHFQVQVLTGDRDAGDSQSLSGIQVDQWEDFDEGIKVYYASPGNLSYANIRQRIQEVQPDLIYLNSMYSLPFTIYPLLMKRRNQIEGRVVLAPRGMLQEGAMQYKSLKKQTFIKGLKALRIPSLIDFHATDQQEHKDILRYFPKARSVEVISNFANPVQPEFTSIEKAKDILRIVFVSRVAAKKNVLGILRSLQQVTCNCECTIIGPEEEASYVKQCKELEATLPENIQINWLGALPPKEVQEHLAANHLFFLPTFGENFGHAIFEALLAGRPVLISDQTPWKDLHEKKAGWIFPVAAEEAFARQLNELGAMDQASYDSWAKGAWEYAGKFLHASDLPSRYISLFSDDSKK